MGILNFLGFKPKEKKKPAPKGYDVAENLALLSDTEDADCKDHAGHCGGHGD